MVKKDCETNYDILDLTKIVLAFMIVAIHSNLFPEQLYPWLRLAVPLFFIISSFLLFKRMNNRSENEKKEIVKKYIVRLLKLYCFWFIVLLPYTIFLRKEWFADGIIIGVIKSIRAILFSSTFPVSWFITATIEGTLIVYFLSKKKKTYILLIATSILSYVLCCLASGYIYLFDDKMTMALKFLEPQFTFLAALIYIIIGKEFAEKKYNDISLLVYICSMIVFGVLLYNEWMMISINTGVLSNDCLLFIMPLSVSLFGIILKINIKLKNAKTLRQLSSFIYPFHFIVIAVVRYIIKSFTSNNTVLNTATFLITCIICIVCFLIVRYLQRFKYFKLLKNSY